MARRFQSQVLQNPAQTQLSTEPVSTAPASTAPVSTAPVSWSLGQTSLQPPVQGGSAARMQKQQNLPQQQAQQISELRQQVHKLVVGQNKTLQQVQHLEQQTKQMCNKSIQQDIQLTSMHNLLKGKLQALQTDVQKLKHKTSHNQSEHRQHIEHMADQYNQLLNHFNEKFKQVKKTIERHNIQLAGHADYLKHAHRQIKSIQQIEARTPLCEKV